MASRGEMKAVLQALDHQVAKLVDRPTEPRKLMEAFCEAVTASRGRPIQLLFRAFPDEVPISGMRLEFKDRVVIVVEERALPESQLVIFGHELWHEWEGHGHCGGGLGVQAAARGMSADQEPTAFQRAVQQILNSAEISPQTVLAVAARSDDHSDYETDAETFGYFLAHTARTHVKGSPYALDALSLNTREGRITRSLHGNRGGIAP